MRSTPQSSTQSDSNRQQQPESHRASADGLFANNSEPTRIPVAINGVTIDLYAIPALLRDAEDAPDTVTASRSNAIVTPALADLTIDQATPYVWDQLVYALSRVESVLDSASHESGIRRAVDRCADLAASEGWTLEMFMARFHTAIKTPTPPADADQGVGSMLHALHARFIAKVLDWGVERFFIASESRAKSARETEKRRA